MKAKLSNKKKILIAASLLGIFLVGAIVSIVLVLAASTQGVASNITVSYNAEGVGAKVSATYAKVPLDLGSSVNRTAMTTSGGGQEITFNLSTAQTTETIAPAGDIILDPQNQEVVFEYTFENLAETAFSIELTETPTGVNMTETYYVSGTRLETRDYRTRITKTTLEPQALTSLGQKVYIYIMASVDNENLKASYNGGFVWSLVARDTIDITLNTDGATSTLKVIPNSIVTGIAMPVLNTIPTKTSYNFDGYYTEGDTQYINRFGASAHIADLTANTVLYADWNQETLVIEDNVVYGLTNVGKTATTLEIPEGTTAIGDSALSGSSITSVTIPNSVETIGNSAFYNSKNLETVTIGDSAQTASYADGSSLKAIGSSAFSGCDKLTSITIPSSVTSIGSVSFSSCSKLESVIIGENSQLTSIGGSVFSNCSALTSITIPSRVTSIGSYAFNACSGLTSVTFAENSKLTSIGENAFYGCSSIMSITIPEGVTIMATGAFAYCSALTEINYNAINCSGVNYGVFMYSGSSAEKLVVNIGEKVRTIPSNVLGVAESRFVSYITEVNFAENSVCENIPRSAFNYCNKLTNITIPISVKSIEMEAFRNCSNLTSVVFKNTSGWWCATSSTATSGTSLSSTDLANTSTAATYLKSTYNYYYWKCTA